jgi:hypothetical protein
VTEIIPRDLLFYVGGRALERYGVSSQRRALAALGGEEFKETFARASIGYFRGADSILRKAASGVHRVEWHDVDGSGALKPCLLLEPSAVNQCLESERIDQSPWANVGAPSVTANAATAPDGTTTADRINDATGGAVRARKQDITVAADTANWCLSAYVQKDTASIWSALLLRFTDGVTPKNYAIIINNETMTAVAATSEPGGESVVAPAAFSATGEATAYGYRFFVAGPNFGTGYTSMQVQCIPAARGTAGTAIQNSGEGATFFWGVDVELGLFPSSYKPTTVSAFTRQMDQMTFPLAAPPQAMTIYAHFIERAQPNWGTPDGAESRVFNVASSGSRLQAWKVNTQDTYAFEHVDGAGSVSSTIDLSPTRGDRIELRYILNTDGSVQLAGSKNGGAESVGIQSAARTLPSTWGEQVLHVGSLGATGAGNIALYKLIGVRGVRSLAECRAVP